MAGFDKIDLDKTKKKEPPPSTTTGMSRRKKKFHLPRWAIYTISVVVVLAILSVFFILLPAIDTYKSAKLTMAQGKLVAAAVKAQNIELASEELAKTKVQLADTQKKLGRLGFTRFIPIVGWYYSDADHMMKAGAEGLETGAIVIDSLKPYADVLGLKGGGSFVMGSAEDRIKTAVMTMGKITPRIDTIADSLDTVRSEIDQINPAHYPKIIFGNRVQDQLTQVKDLTDQGTTFISQARPLIKVLPTLLGESKEKKYLVIFQNDKELRPTGGFITGYSIFKIDKGVITVDRSDDIYKLDDSIPNHPRAPEPILKYLPKVYTLNIRDSNLSPDYIESMKTFYKMYQQSSQKENIDGIIAIDTYVLTSTIKVLDDQITTDGITFTTKNDPRCDCPQVIYELENNISRPVNYIKTDRKQLLSDLLYALMKKALAASPKIYWGPLFQTMIAQTTQKHVLFDLFDTNAQSGIEALNAAGRIKPFDGDYLHINDTNFAGAKSNLFTTQEVENSYDVKGDGTIEKTVTITYKNNHPPSDCNLERGGLCLNAELRDWVRVYVPKGSTLISNKGSQVKISTYDDLGKTVFEGFTSVRPMGVTKYSLTYRLPFKLKSGSVLPVLIQKQPGTDGNTYTDIFNGRTVDTFQLFADKELKLK